jgi:hypothetical protein
VHAWGFSMCARITLHACCRLRRTCAWLPPTT